MNKTLIFTLLLLTIFFLYGCQGIDLSKISDKDITRIAEKAIVCNEPYIRFGTGCCLDQNNNKICDSDETVKVEVSEPMKPEEIEEELVKKEIGEEIDCSRFRLSISGVSFEVGTLKFEIENGDYGSGMGLVKIKQDGREASKKIYIEQYGGLTYSEFHPQADPAGIKMDEPLEIEVAVIDLEESPVCKLSVEYNPTTGLIRHDTEKEESPECKEKCAEAFESFWGECKRYLAVQKQAGMYAGPADSLYCEAYRQGNACDCFCSCGPLTYNPSDVTID